VVQVKRKLLALRAPPPVDALHRQVRSYGSHTTVDPDAVVGFLEERGVIAVRGDESVMYDLQMAAGLRGDQEFKVSLEVYEARSEFARHP